jgi:hypothetical protein
MTTTTATTRTNREAWLDLKAQLDQARDTLGFDHRDAVRLESLEALATEFYLANPDGPAILDGPKAKALANTEAEAYVFGILGTTK